MTGPPTLEQVRAWIKVPASQLSDEDLQQILDAELAIQARLLRVTAGSAFGASFSDAFGDDDYPAALSRACLRRCQREVAARNVPLGLVGSEAAEYGQVRLPAWDAEIARLEASYRIPVIA